MGSIDWRKLEDLAGTVANAKDAFVVGVEGRKEGARRLIRVLVDTDEGISIAQCAEISRDLGSALDEQNIINEPYELEVSSPGIEKPLKFLRQYRKNIGRKFKVEYSSGGERRTLIGTLKEINGETLVFDAVKLGSVSIEFSNILESIEELPW